MSSVLSMSAAQAQTTPGAASPPAADPPPAATPPAADPAGAGPQKSQPTVVVVSDVTGDVTRDAQLRAKLYEVARARGYESAGRLDAHGAAEREGLMTAGQITMNEAELQRLRQALGVSLLLRAGKKAEQGGTVSVQLVAVSERGASTRVVEAPRGAIDPPVRAALEQMLGPPTGPPATGEAEPAEPAESQVVAGGLVLPGDAGAHPAKKSAGEVREAWERRGGVVLTYGVSFLATFQQIQNIPVSDRDRQNRLVEDQENANGVGGGIGGRLGMLYLPLPDPTLSKGVFPGFRLGIGLDMNFLYNRRPVGYDFTDEGREVRFDDQALWVPTATAQIGLLLGIGEFRTLDTWRGAVVGLAYSPAGQFQMDLAETSGDFRFNPAGAELTIDIASLSTEAGEAAETQIRFSLLGLFPIDDDRPGMVTGGFGFHWY